MQTKSAQRDHDLHAKPHCVGYALRPQSAIQDVLLHKQNLAFWPRFLQNLSGPVLHQHVRQHPLPDVHQRGPLPGYRLPLRIQDSEDQTQRENSLLRGLVSSAIRRFTRRLFDGHHVVRQRQVLLRKVFELAVGVQGLQSGGLYGDGGLLDSAHDKHHLLHEGPADPAAPGEPQPGRATQQSQDLAHDRGALAHFLFLLHPVQRQPGVLHAGAKSGYYKLHGGVGGPDYLSDRILHSGDQLLLRPRDLLLHLGDHPELH